MFVVPRYSQPLYYRTNYLYSELILSICSSRDVGSAKSLCLVEKWKNTLHKQRQILFTCTQIFFSFYFPTVTLNRWSRVSKCYVTVWSVPIFRPIKALLSHWALFPFYNFLFTCLNVKFHFKLNDTRYTKSNFLSKPLKINSLFVLFAFRDWFWRIVEFPVPSNNLRTNAFLILKQPFCSIFIASLLSFLKANKCLRYT